MVLLIVPAKDNSKRKLTKQDRCLIRNDKSLLHMLDTSKLDTESLQWIKTGK
jgi:hypothetical protein